MEIAETMQVSVNTVKTQKKKAYKILRTLLGTHYLNLLVIYGVLEKLNHS